MKQILVKLFLLSTPLILNSEVRDLEADKINNEIGCLAMNVYYEARGEPRLGQIAVANVTMNRVRSSSYPNSVCGVVTQRTTRVCQFSWVCKLNRLPDVRPELYDRIKVIAKKSISMKSKMSPRDLPISIRLL